MASIREQFLNGSFEVSHAGTSRTFTIPTVYEGISDEILYSEERLTEFLKARGIFLEVLHTGLQQEMVNFRAIPRKKVSKTGEDVPMTDENVLRYQETISAYKPKLMPRPATQADKILDATETMNADQLLELMAKIERQLMNKK